MYQHRLTALTAVFLLASLPAHGQFSSKKKATPPPPPTQVTLTAQMPTLTPLPESDPSQVKDGLRITLSPETYQAMILRSHVDQPAVPHSFLGVTMSPDPRAVYIQRTHSAQMAPKPDNLVFHVHISNQLPRVFRGSGIAVQFNVAGKNVPVDPTGYGELVNILIPPRGEQDVTIVGPPIASIPSPCTIGIFLYDVVTKMDQAGNVTDKQNYEWYFSYKTQAFERQVDVPATTAGWVIPGQQ